LAKSKARWSDWCSALLVSDHPSTQLTSASSHLNTIQPNWISTAAQFRPRRGEVLHHVTPRHTGRKFAVVLGEMIDTTFSKTPTTTTTTTTTTDDKEQS